MSVSVVYTMIFSNLLHGNAIIYLTSLPIYGHLAHSSVSATQKIVFVHFLDHVFRTYF